MARFTARLTPEQQETIRHGTASAQAPIGSPVLKSPSRIDAIPVAAVPAQDMVTQPKPSIVAAQSVQARTDHQELATLKNQLAQLERELADRGADLDHIVEERADLNRRLTEAQSNSLALEARLSLLGNGPPKALSRRLSSKDRWTTSI
jgi:septal ring factor EnvC (AmiA/AmiB activator)